MIALVDCNNFFASCERLFRPDLKEKPVLVLSNNDGCVVARSKEVKELGIPMGVPYFKVRDIIKSNNVQCFSSNFALYSNISQRILSVLQSYAPQIEVYSIDEAFMNLQTLNHADCLTWGEQLQHEILRTVGMPVSVGIAPTKTLAKLASAYAKKHNQVCLIDPDKEERVYKSVLKSTPVGDIWGVGRRLAPKFIQAGIRNALQLSGVSERWIRAQFGIVGTRKLQELKGIVMHGFEDVAVPQKSLMASRSFGHIVKNLHELESAVATFASQAAYRLRFHEQVTHYFGIYLRYKNPDGQIKGQSTAQKLILPTNDTSELVHSALQQLAALYDGALGYKKAGVFAGQLSSANICQVNLFEQTALSHKPRRDQFFEAIDSINKKYGSQTIHVSSIDPKSKRWQGKKERISPSYITDWSQLPLVHPFKD